MNTIMGQGENIKHVVWVADSQSHLTLVHVMTVILSGVILLCVQSLFCHQLFWPLLDPYYQTASMAAK